MHDIEKEFATNPKLKSHFPNVVVTEALKLQREDTQEIIDKYLKEALEKSIRSIQDNETNNTKRIDRFN